MSRNQPLCRDLVDILQLSSNVTATGKEAKRLRVDTAHVLDALKRGETVDRAKVRRILSTLDAEAQQGRAYMDWVTYVLRGLERDWCEASPAKTPKRSPRRSPRFSPRALFDSPRRSPRRSPNRSPRFSPRALFHTPEREITPRPPSPEPRDDQERQRRNRAYLARNNRYHTLKKAVVRSAQKRRESMHSR